MNKPVIDSHLIKETLIGGRADAEVAAIVTLSSLAEDVGGRMPEDTLA